MPHHAPNQKPKPKPHGPKERELAVALTVAALGAAKIDDPLAVVAPMTLEVYERMLAALTKPGPGESEDGDRGD